MQSTRRQTHQSAIANVEDTVCLNADFARNHVAEETGSREGELTRLAGVRVPSTVRCEKVHRNISFLAAQDLDWRPRFDRPSKRIKVLPRGLSAKGVTVAIV